MVKPQKKTFLLRMDIDQYGQMCHPSQIFTVLLLVAKDPIPLHVSSEVTEQPGWPC